MKIVRTLAIAVLLGALALTATGCSDKDTAAKVNGEAISVTELDKQVAQLKKQYPQMFEGADGEGRLIDFKQRLLDNLVNQLLVKQAAEEKGLKVSDAEVEKQIKQLKAGFKDDKGFEQAISSAGMTVDSLTQQIKDQLLTQKLIASLESNDKATAGRDQGLLRQEQVAVLPEGLEARVPHPVQAGGRGPGQEGARDAQEGRRLRRSSRRSTRSIRPPRPRAATWAGRPPRSSPSSRRRSTSWIRARPPSS